MASEDVASSGVGVGRGGGVGGGGPYDATPQKP